MSSMNDYQQPKPYVALAETSFSPPKKRHDLATPLVSQTFSEEASRHILFPSSEIFNDTAALNILGLKRRTELLNNTK